MSSVIAGVAATGLTATGLLEVAAEEALKKSSENIVAWATENIAALFKTLDESAALRLGNVFCKYLNNAAYRYNQVHTLTTGSNPRSIIGADSIYVQIDVMPQQSSYQYHSSKAKKPRISTASPEHILNAIPKGKSPHILILGTGGAGKTILLRHLFLVAAGTTKGRIPVFLELSKMNDLQPSSESITELIYHTMKDDFASDLTHTQFEKTVDSGKYLFLLDGLDEIRHELFDSALEAIGAFCSKNRNNACIMTSRPRPDLIPPDTFTVLESKPLTREQAVKMASLLGKTEANGCLDEKTVAFCSELRDRLFQEHRALAENPLLLSVLYLTFIRNSSIAEHPPEFYSTRIRNSSIPAHPATFYEQTYETLYSAHDGNKDHFQRDFRCKNLDEGQFRQIFAKFCFRTWFPVRKERFTESELIAILDKCIHDLGLSVNAKDYLCDLRESVCLIIGDKNTLRFIYSPIQIYFAAYYTSNLIGEKQQALFERVLYKETIEIDRWAYFELLCQIKPNPFAINALERGLRQIQAKADTADLTDGKGAGNHVFLQIATSGVLFCPNNTPVVGRRMLETLGYNLTKCPSVSPSNLTLILGIYFDYYTSYSLPGSVSYFDRDREFINECLNRFKQPSRRGICSFRAIDEARALSETDREALYIALTRLYNIQDLRQSVKDWLLQLDNNRDSTQTSLAGADFFDRF